MKIRTLSVALYLVLGVLTPAYAADHAVNLGFTPGKIFTFFLLTLGPFGAIKPFATATNRARKEERIKVAFATIGISFAAVLLASIIGGRILDRWGVSTAALLITAGVMLFLVALNSVRTQYAHPAEAASASSPHMSIARTAFDIAFPYIVSPYGIAVVVLVATTRTAGTSLWGPVSILAGIMLLNCAVLLVAHGITRSILLVPAMAVTSSVLSVLQAALGVQAILAGLKSSGVF